MRFLYQPLQPNISYYCAKVVLSLVTRNPKDMVRYFQTKKNFIANMVDKLYCQGVPELLLQIATSEQVPGLPQVLWICNNFVTVLVDS